MAFLWAVIHSTNILGPETAPGPGSAAVYLVDKASVLRRGMGHRFKQIHHQHSFEVDTA